MKDILLAIIYICIIAMFVIAMFCYQTPAGRIGECVLVVIGGGLFFIYNYLDGRD